MRISKSRFRQIIQEEIQKALHENFNDRMAMLRDYLYKKEWENLFDHLSQWEGQEGFEIGLDYAESHAPHDLELSYKKNWEGKRAEKLSMLTGNVPVDHDVVAKVTQLPNLPFFKYVNSLEIDGHGVGDNFVQALANSPYSQNLKKLSLDNNNITIKGVKAIANSEHLAGIVELSLFNNRWTTPGGLEIVETAMKIGKLPNLDKLDMDEKYSWDEID